MYAFVEGEIIEKHDDYVVIRPDGMGVGLILQIAPRTSLELPGIGGTVRLHTSFQVREDSQTLFGFSTVPERDLFEALLKISGVGGRTAIAILDLPRDRIVEAIAAGDSGVLTTVPGVGAKTAGRIVLELKDRFAEELMEEWGDLAAYTVIPGTGGASDTGSRIFMEAVEALVELGYQRADARDRVRKARGEVGEDVPAEELVRHVLRHAG
jgi:Holliday junction DNA helicase RuvA